MLLIELKSDTHTEKKNKKIKAKKVSYCMLSMGRDWRERERERGKYKNWVKHSNLRWFGTVFRSKLTMMLKTERMDENVLTETKAYMYAKKKPSQNEFHTSLCIGQCYTITSELDFCPTHVWVWEWSFLFLIQTMAMCELTVWKLT